MAKKHDLTPRSKESSFQARSKRTKTKKVETKDVSGDSEMLEEMEEMELVSVRQEAQLIVNVEDQCEESEKQNRPFKTPIEASAESESSLSLSSMYQGLKEL